MSPAPELEGYEVMGRAIERLEALDDETDSRADHELLLEEIELLRSLRGDPVEEKIRADVEGEFVQDPPEAADE